MKYRDDRKPLVNWIYANIDRSLIKHFKDGNDGRRVPDTDPFTVMAIINRGITWEKKISLCKRFKEFLNISAPVPQDFSGVPEMNNMLSNFMAFEEDRKEGDIERLWKLFECAVLDKDIEEAYNALKEQYLIKYNITMGLFWIRPDRFLALDGNNKEKLKSLGIASFDGKFVVYKDYKAIMERLDEKMASGEIVCNSYAEFSHEAYVQNDGASTRDTAKEPTPINYGKSYWMYSPGEQASKWQECQNDGIMCIGWDDLGDLSRYGNREDMRMDIKKYYPTDGSAKNDSLAVWQFSREMKEGDVVFAKKGLTKIVGRGVVASDYLFDTSRKEFKHIRRVKWTHIGEWETTDKSAMKTLTNITRYKEYVEELNRLIGGKGATKPTATDGKQYWWLTGNPKYWSPSKDWELGDDIDYTLYNKKGNKKRVFKHFLEARSGDLVIAYESTPKLQIVALGRVVSETDGEVLSIRKTEELLSPIPYDDILNNPLLKESEPVKNRCQGSLFLLTKDEYEEIMRLVRETNPEPTTEDEEDESEEYAPYSDEDFLKKVYMNRDAYEQLKALLLRKKNLILQGAPGVGKTFAAKRLAYAIMGEKNRDRVKVVQFHQNYSYEDFVLGYKPNENGGFDLQEGIFYQFCRKAATDKEHEYFFIIDEINRGNLSKIFGELLMMIEKGYRDTPMQMSYADRRFAVPSNVYLIGMMNTADRSLAMIDYALRRRFSFYEMKPAFENTCFRQYIEKQHDPHLEKLVEALVELNKVIASDDSLGTGFCIGHSYLCDLEDGYDLENIVEYDILPMLREYWFDNDERYNSEARELRKAISDDRR